MIKILELKTTEGTFTLTFCFRHKYVDGVCACGRVKTGKLAQATCR